MYCTVTEQKMELEICVHETILHPSEENEMEQNEMRFSEHLHTEQHSQCVRGSVAEGEAGRESPRLFPICVTLSSRVSGWFVLLHFLLSTSLPRQARGGLRFPCVPLLFIHLLSDSTIPPPPPPPFFWLLYFTPTGLPYYPLSSFLSPLHLWIISLTFLFPLPLAHSLLLVLYLLFLVC